MKPTVAGRLRAQGLVGPPFEATVDVVRHLGCVQSQLPDMAMWAVARRTAGLTLREVQQSLDAGDVVRTHVLRPTWHLVAPDDLGWLLALTGPRIDRLLATSGAGLGLTEAVLDRGTEVVVAALAGGDALTRDELAVHLAEAGLPHRGQALAHLVMHVEVHALVVSGPLRGRQQTYVRFAGAPVTSTREEQLAQAAVRYGRGHGSFRAKDLAWWTSLTLTDSRRAIELAGLPVAELEGEAYALVEVAGGGDVPQVMLLPAFDEYISYVRDPDDLAAFDGPSDDILRGTGLLVLDGRLAGTWTRTVAARTVTIRVRTQHRVTAARRRGIDDEAQRFAAFVERDPVVELAS